MLDSGIIAMVFDIKMDDFHRKTHLMAGVHMTHTPIVITYSSVDTRDSVFIASTMTVLHDLDVKAADVLTSWHPTEKRYG